MKDITKFAESIEWEGSDTQASRMATVSVAYNPYDKINLNMTIGDLLYLQEKKTIFVGVITSMERTGDIGTLSYVARDFMHYLLRSNGSYNFKKITAEKITKKLCGDLLIQTTNVYATKTYIKSLLFESAPYYNMIVSAYNAAAKKMSAEYPPVFMPVMDGMKLSVIIKGKKSGIKLKSNSDITQSSYSKNTDDMITQVWIVNDKNKRIGTVQNKTNLNKYGIYQEIYQKEKGVNSKTAAKRLLKGITKEASVEALGYTECIAGYSIEIQDKPSGLTGTFYIESDKHTWKDGVHTMNLTLKFSNGLEAVS